MSGATVAPVPADVVRAATRLRSWGFLAKPDLPDQPGDAELLVAIRPRPTLIHFDPELVGFWVNDGGRGAPATLTLSTPRHPPSAFAWGTIRIVDRLGISNEYVTFGGSLEVGDVDGTRICVFRSPAPLLRRGGHSQGWDRASAEAAAFFARMLVPVSGGHGFEARFAEAGPLERYSAFVAEYLTRHGPHSMATGGFELWALLRCESTRLRRDHPGAWAAGTELLKAAGLSA